MSSENPNNKKGNDKPFQNIVDKINKLSKKVDGIKLKDRPKREPIKGQEGIIDPAAIKKSVDRYLAYKDNLPRRDADLFEYMRSDPIAQKHEDFAEILEKAQNKDSPEYRAAMALGNYLEPLKNIRTQNLKNYGLKFADKSNDARYANAALDNYLYSKFDVAPEEMKNIEKELQQWVVATYGQKSITNKQLKRLLALDDFSSILGWALPHIKKYGAKAINWLHDKYIAPTLKEWEGNDEGINPIDAVDPMLSYKTSYIRGLNKEIPGVRAPNESITTSDSVSTHSLKTTICPESYVHRYATKFAEKTALGSYNYELSRTTNSAGNCLVIISPSAFFSTSTNMVSTYNDTTLSIDTLNQVPNPDSVTCPISSMLTGGVEVAKQVRLTGFSITVVPVVSYNTPGYIQLAYFTSGNANTLGVPTGPISGYVGADLPQAPFYSSGNNKTVYRMIALPNNTIAEGWNVIGRDVFLLLLSGFTPNTTAVKIIMNISFEFLPRSPYYPICPVSVSQQGPLTGEFLMALIARYPLIQMLTLEDAKEFAAKIPDCQMGFNELLELIKGFVGKYKQKSTTPIFANSEDMVGSIASFEV